MRPLTLVCGGLLITPFLSAPPILAQESRTPQTKISINASKVLNPISPWLAGSCIEDVNHEIYGGLYDQKIFGESFEEPAPRPKIKGWTALGGDWVAADEAIAVAADSGAKLQSETPAFANGSVAVRLKFPAGKGSNAGLIVRLSEAGVGADAFTGYEVSLDPGAQRLILGKHRHNWQLLQTASVSFNPKDWTKLRVSLNGPRIQVFVGDSATPTIDFTDSQAPILTGAFGLRTWNSDAVFRDCVVKPDAQPEPFVSMSAEDISASAVSGQWDAVRSDGATGKFSLDTGNPFNGKLSQKIEHGNGTGVVGVANRGLNRWGIAVKRGQRLGGRLYLRASDLQGRVTLSLQSGDGSRTYASQQIAKVGAHWAKFSISLKPEADDSNARFVISLDKPGTLWVDQVVLTGTGTAQFKGLPIRADIAHIMQQQGIKFLRYGGTMVNAPEYRWKNMIGDPDKRPPYRGHWYPHSTNGFGIEEFLRFCESAGFEPVFAINVEESAQDVADMVEYLKGDASNPWGRRRTQNGHHEPYNIRRIELGNEEVIWGDNAADYDHYVERFNLLSAAMHAKDPQLELICAAWWRPDSPNMERVFKALQGKAAYWDLHVWSDDANAGNNVDRDIRHMQSLFRQWVPNSPMKCVILEENGNLHNQQRALGHATTLNAVRRHGDFVVASCPANALQPDGQNDNGWDQGQIFFNSSQVWGMPPFYAAQMANSNEESQRVETTVAGDLDVTASRSVDGKVLVLHIVNIAANETTAAITLNGFPGLQVQATQWILSGPPQTANSVTETHIRSVESQIKVGYTFSNVFPAHSYTVIRLSAK